MSDLPIGKLPPELLAELLRELPSDPRVILGPRPGEDAAVIEMPDRYLVAKTDPITFATDMVGWYAVQVCANDIATTGAVPLWFMATILLPGNSATSSMARDVFAQISDACRKLNVAVVGGHTEITYGLDRPIVVGSMLGEVDKKHLIRTGGAAPGDAIFLTKGAPVEATAIIAREKHDELCARFDDVWVKHCADYLFDPGISVVRDARLAMQTGAITSMHDPTEGGVLTALWELADASGYTIHVDLFGRNTPWLPDAVALCQAFDLDPAAAIASGALLLTIPQNHGMELETLFGDANISLFRLGTIQFGDPCVIDRQHGKISRPERDEIAKLYD